MARNLVAVRRLPGGRHSARWMALASCGMMMTCGTGTGTGNAAPLDLRQPAYIAQQGAAALACGPGTESGAGLRFACVVRRFSRG